jgi:hypothetical protein
MAVSYVPEGQRFGALVLRTKEKCATDPGVFPGIANPFQVLPHRFR